LLTWPRPVPAITIRGSPSPPARHEVGLHARVVVEDRRPVLVGRVHTRLARAVASAEVVGEVREVVPHHRQRDAADRRKVERYELCIFRQRVPRWRRAYWSEVGRTCRSRPRRSRPFRRRTAWMRLRAASLDGRSLERCEPTITIGTGVSWTMNDRMPRCGPWCRAVADHDPVDTVLDLPADGLGEATYCSFAMFSRRRRRASSW